MSDLSQISQPGTHARSDQPHLCSSSKPHTLSNQKTQEIQIAFRMIRQVHDVIFLLFLSLSMPVLELSDERDDSRYCGFCW